MTLVEMLEGSAARHAAKAAIIFRDRVITYGELNIIVNKLSNSLIKRGLGKGDRVGLMLPRVPELVIVFMAAAKCGAIACPVNYELAPEKISEILRSISARFVFAHGGLAECAKASMTQVSDSTVVEAGERREGGGLHFDDLLEEGSAGNPGIDVTDADTVYLNYTSGTTGDSKGAVTTHSNIYWNTIASVDAFSFTQDDVHLCMFAPFAHPHEIFARPLYLGGTMVLLDTVFPKSLAEAISGHGVTAVMGLAPMYENLLELLEHKDYDLSSLRVPESGGMYTRPELIERFRKRLGIPIYPVWGSTEATGIALAQRYGSPVRPGSVGTPCLSYEVKVVDEDGVELPAGEVGEMLFRGPAVVSGYYENRQSTEKAFCDGWYSSGDLARKDKDGYFYFVERKSGMMKVAGLKVFPTEIELAILDHPGVKEVSVISVRDRLRGEVPKAIVVAKAGVDLSVKELLGFCKNKLANYKIPRVVEFRQELPKTPSGKINKKTLQMEHA